MVHFRHEFQIYLNVLTCTVDPLIYAYGLPYECKNELPVNARTFVEVSSGLLNSVKCKHNYTCMPAYFISTTIKGIRPLGELVVM